MGWLMRSSIEPTEIGDIMRQKPATLADIYAEQDFWMNRRRRAQARRENAERTIEQTRRHTGITVMVQQVADLLQPHFPNHTLRVLGPFGLTNEAHIHADDNSLITDTDRFYKTVGSLSFRPSHDARGRLVLVDRHRNSGEYAVGTIGEINGLNYAEVELPDTIEELAGVLRASINARVSS